MPLTARPVSSQGTTALLITRATVFRGRAVEPGETFDDCTPNEVATLVGCGRAIRRPTPPVRSIDIQVAAGAPARETASIEPRTETAALPSAPTPAARRRKA